MNSNIEKYMGGSRRAFSRQNPTNIANKKYSISPNCNIQTQKLGYITCRAWKSINKNTQLSKYALRSANRKKQIKQNSNEGTNCQNFSLRNILAPGALKIKSSNQGLCLHSKRNCDSNQKSPEKQIFEFTGNKMLNKARSDIKIKNDTIFQIKGFSMDQNRASFTTRQEIKSCLVRVMIHKKTKYFPQYRLRLSKNINITENVRELMQLKEEIIGFQSIPRCPYLDYFITLTNENCDSLNQMELTFKPIIRNKQLNISINSFQIINCIGTGGFSKVYLVRFKQDGQFYAMKVIDKDFIIKHKKKKIVMHERNVMSALNHPFIIQMKFAFESYNSIIFVLEFCPGGELFGLVKRYRVMNQSMAKFYAIQILLGLEHIHQNCIVYRDFKPQNILLDKNGHIRIADFGLAKPEINSMRKKAFSFCGSPQYMPPQMILKKGHSFPVDFYCLGALLYELVTGLPPFYSKNADEIYQGTLNKPLTFPKHSKISIEMKSLLMNLLCKDESKRLGSLAGVKQVFCHPWFGKIDRQAYLSKQVCPPVSFTELQDIQKIFRQIQNGNQENSQGIRFLVQEQKKQSQKKYQIIMDNFSYDYRKQEDSADQSRKQSKKEKRKKKNSIKKQNNISRELETQKHIMKKPLKLSTSRSQTSFCGFRKKKEQLSARCIDLKNFIR